jgi:hypothetical protein
MNKKTKKEMNGKEMANKPHTMYHIILFYWPINI